MMRRSSGATSAAAATAAAALLLACVATTVSATRRGRGLSSAVTLRAPGASRRLRADIATTTPASAAADAGTPSVATDADTSTSSGVWPEEMTGRVCVNFAAQN
jgi:hypothetical protein